MASLDAVDADLLETEEAIQRIEDTETPNGDHPSNPWVFSDESNGNPMNRPLKPMNRGGFECNESVGFF